MRYEDPANMLSRVKDVVIIDLFKHAIALDPELTQALVEPEEGIYLRGSVEPFISRKHQYYTRATYGAPGKTKDISDLAIKDFSIILDLREDLLDESGNVVLPAQSIRKYRKYMSLKPDMPVTAIRLARQLVLDYLSHLCPYTRTVMRWSLITFIKEDKQHLFYDDAFECAFEKLLDEVDTFVGDDNWFYYFNKIQGTSLILEKTVDIRIYEWHKRKYEDQLAQDEQAAGLY